MSEANLFKRIVSPRGIETAMVATINWLIGSYLGEIERLEGYAPNQIERPRAVVTRSEFETMAEDQIPVILVICTGLAGPPERRADSSYDAAWTVGVAAVVSDVDESSTRDLAMAYGTAIRTLVSQHKMLKSPLHPDGFAQFSRWQDEQYTDMPALAERSLAAARVIFSIGVEGVVTEQAGPRVPLADPTVDPGAWPTVQSATATTIPIGIEEALTP